MTWRQGLCTRSFVTSPWSPKTSFHPGSFSTPVKIALSYFDGGLTTASKRLPNSVIFFVFEGFIAKQSLILLCFDFKLILGKAFEILLVCLCCSDWKSLTIKTVTTWRWPDVYISFNCFETFHWFWVMPKISICLNFWTWVESCLWENVIFSKQSCQPMFVWIKIYSGKDLHL